MTEEKEKRLITSWQKSDDNLVPPQYLAEVRCGDKDQCPGSPTLTNNVFIRLIRGTPALHLNEAADGSCCDAGLGLVWHCYWIYMSFVCLIPKKNICFGFLKGRGCVESKNKTSAKRKSILSSLDPSIIQVASFKCRADIPL